jgi:hypothetical protein
MTTPAMKRTRALRLGAGLLFILLTSYGCATDDSAGELAGEVAGDIISIGPKGDYTMARFCKGLDRNGNGISDNCECPAEIGISTIFPPSTNPDIPTPPPIVNKWLGISSRDINVAKLNQDLARFKVSNALTAIPVPDPMTQGAVGTAPVNVTVCYKLPAEPGSGFPSAQSLFSKPVDNDRALLVAAATAVTASYAATRLLNDMNDWHALDDALRPPRNLYRDDAKEALIVRFGAAAVDETGSVNSGTKELTLDAAVAYRGLSNIRAACNDGVPVAPWSVTCSATDLAQVFRHEFFHLAQQKKWNGISGMNLTWATEGTAGAQGLEAFADYRARSSEQLDEFITTFAARPELSSHRDEKSYESFEPYHSKTMIGTNGSDSGLDDILGNKDKYRGELFFAFLKRLGDGNRRTVEQPFSGVHTVGGSWPSYESAAVDALEFLPVVGQPTLRAGSSYLTALLGRYRGLEMPVREAYRRFALASFLTGRSSSPLTPFMPHIVTEPGLTRGSWRLQAPAATVAQNAHPTRMPGLTETERYSFSKYVNTSVERADAAGDRLRLALPTLESSSARGEYIRIGKNSGSVESVYDMPPYTFRIVTLAPGEDGKCGAGNLSVKAKDAYDPAGGDFYFDDISDPDYSTTDRSRDQIGWIVGPSFASQTGDQVTFTTERLYPGELPPVVGGKTFLVLTNATVRPMRVITTVDGKRGEEDCGNARIPARPPAGPAPGNGVTCSVPEEDWRMYTSAGIPRTFSFDWNLNATAGYLLFKPEQLGANDRIRISYGGFEVYDSGCAAIPTNRQVLVPMTGASSFRVAVDFNCGNVAEEIGPRSTGSIAALKWSCGGTAPDAGAPQ